MIHLELIKKHAIAKPNVIAFKTSESETTWKDFQKNTEEKIIFLLMHYDRDLPSQASYIASNRGDLLPWLSALATLGIPVTGLDYTLPLRQLREMNIAIGAELVLFSSAIVCTDVITQLAQPSAMLIDLDSITTAYMGVVDNQHADVLTLIADRNLPKRQYRTVGFTSGTSGNPKPVIRDTPFDSRRFTYFTQHYKFSDQDRFLAILPIYHAAGNGWVRLFLSLGASIFIDTYDSPFVLKNILENEKITASVMSPIILNGLINAFPEDAKTALPALRWLLIGGKHFTASLKLRALSVLGPSVHEYYGTTETGVNTLANPDDLLTHPHSVGRAYDGNTIMIVAPDNKPVAPGISGTVIIDSYMNMLCYAGGCVSQLQIEGRRYLVTPEQGYLDDEGRLYLLNRMQDPGNVCDLYGLEDVIRTLPNVSDVAILPFKVPDATGLVCILSLKVPCEKEPILIDRIQHLARDRDITFKKCAVLPIIPYSPTGKVKIGEIGNILMS
ncbi:MAG: AMP-binding protein [Janthinobacterium lividum]